LKDNIETTRVANFTRNVLWGLFGQAAPMIIAVFSIPYLIQKLGTERFGVLTILWVFVGYFSIFDLGLGRAVTQAVAHKLGEQKFHEVRDIVKTAALLMFGVGLIGTLIIAALAPLLTFQILHIPENLISETRNSLFVVAIATPLIVTNSGWSGLLEALQRFDLANFIKAFLGFWTYLSPVIVVQYTVRLEAVLLTLVSARILAFLMLFIASLKAMKDLPGPARFKKELIKPLTRYGGWLTITNIVSPLMTQLDRFFIGAILTVAAVAYYTVPLEVMSKILIIQTAVTGALLPALTRAHSLSEAHIRKLFEAAMKAIFLLVFPVVVFIFIFAPELLRLWVGEQFVIESTPTVRWLCAAIMINSLSAPSVAFLWARGRTDITAKIHLLELPLYLGAVYFFVSKMGLVGAAIAWTLRHVMDNSLLTYNTSRFMKLDPLRPSVLLPVVLALIPVFLSVLTPISLQTKLLVSALTLAAIIPSVWFLFFTSRDRAFLVGKLGRFF